MIENLETEGEQNNASETVKCFSLLFQSSFNANTIPSTKHWKAHQDYLDDRMRVGFAWYILGNTSDGHKQARLRIKRGLRKERPQWVNDLQMELQSEYDRLHKWIIKFNLNALRLFSLQ